MTDTSAFSFANPAIQSRIATVSGAIGVVWGAVEALVALEVISSGSAISSFDGRTGWGVGLVMVALWLGAAAAVVLIGRMPALAASLLFVAACGGFLAVGEPWIGPGSFLAVASWFALLCTPNPFAAEREREAAARADAG